MKKQDTEESATQSSEDSPPAAGGTDSSAPAKDSLDSPDSYSPKESEPQTPQTDTPPQSDEAGSEGINLIMYTREYILYIVEMGISFVGLDIRVVFSWF